MDVMMSGCFKSMRMYEFAFPFSSLEKSAIDFEPIGGYRPCYKSTTKLNDVV